MLIVSMPDLDPFLDDLDRYRRHIGPAILHTVQATANDAVIWARAQRLSGPPPGILQVRTGRLRASFRASVQQRGATTTASVGFLAPDAPPWAWVHEEGATIRPRTARFLTIPLAGVTGRARDYPETFVRGRVLYQRTASGMRPLFLLAGQVEIPPRPVLAPTWHRYAPLLLQRLAVALTP